MRNLRHAVSTLVREKSFTLLTLLTLALAIGANTAIFSVVHSVLLAPLPYPEGERLVTMYNLYPGVGVTERGANSAPDYFDRRAETEVFEQVALLDTERLNLGTEGTPEQVTALRVTPDVFPLLRAMPALGRSFSEEDTVPGNERVAILTDALWQKHFGGDPAALGKMIRLHGVEHQVIGVMPRGFELLSREARLLVPFAFTAEQKADDSHHSNFAAMIARLKPGITVAQAQQRVTALNQRVMDKTPEIKPMLETAGFWTKVAGFKDDLVREVAGSLVLVQGGVLLLLLIGCVNVANLMLVRAQKRKRELAVQFALGAGRRQVLGQILTESLLLAAVGGVLGLALGWLGVEGISAFAAENLPRGSHVSLNGSVLGFTLALTLATGLVFGLIPAVQAMRSDLATVFRDGGRSGSAGKRSAFTRSALVVVQCSLAFVLLIAAGLLLASFGRVAGVEPGFRTTGVLTASVVLPESRYSEPSRVAGFVEQAHAALAALPGVERVGLTSFLPFSNSQNASVITFEGKTLAPGENPPVPHFAEVDPGFLPAMGIEILEGRNFETTDTASTGRVVIVDEQLAKRYFPAGDALGRRLRGGVGNEVAENPWSTIVGVSRRVRTLDLAEPDDVGGLYFPLAQQPRRALSVVLTSTGDPSLLASSARQAITRLDAELPLFDLKTMADRVSDSLTTRRAPMMLLAMFAVVALLLSAVGIYGVVTYSVEQRTREMGIRSALGALPSTVARLVLWQGGRLIALGLALGLGGALASQRLLSSQLYGVRATEPSVFLVVATVLALIGLAACLRPSLRASRVDPVLALKAD